ncbi:MAG TPA: molybdenum cofactor guanylyltransferase, partial [Thermomicrobiales bacterium]|nr:molybdenum cofactor guanylyltransferase [Thermomicrobiales bacterium]
EAGEGETRRASLACRSRRGAVGAAVGGEGTLLSVAVLAGGMSRRMGSDKAMLRLGAGDAPLLQLALERVRPLTDDCFVVASDRPAYARFGAPVVADRRPGLGPLGGIATALAAARHDFVLVVACDMPLLSLPLLRFMRDVPRDYDVLVPTLRGESRQGKGAVYQTLHAIYSRRCLAPIETRLDAGQLQVVGLFDQVTVREIDEASVRRHDPDLHSFVNANTPEAAAAAWRLLAAEAAAGNLLETRSSPILEGVERKDDDD